MQSVIRCALAALFLSTLPALADTMPNPYVVLRVVRCSGTIISGGSSQTAISATANTGSKLLFIQNPPNATEDLFVDMGESATSSGSIDLAAGSVFTMGGGSTIVWPVAGGSVNLTVAQFTAIRKAVSGWVAAWDQYAAGISSVKPTLPVTIA